LSIDKTAILMGLSVKKREEPNVYFDEKGALLANQWESVDPLIHSLLKFTLTLHTCAKKKRARVRQM